jgi:hypothetical protein
MSSDAIFFAWNRPIPGRERLSAKHFEEFGQDLGGLQQLDLWTKTIPV